MTDGMTFKFDLAAARARFHELKAERDSIRERSTGVRAERDRLESETRALLSTLDEQIKAIEDPLPGIKEELAFLCRALNGKTGAVQ